MAQSQPKDATNLQATGPYMLQELVDELPLDTHDQEGVEITCVEACEGNLYVGTSAHEILHFVSIPASTPATPHPTSDKFPSQKPVYILASRIEPPAAATQNKRQFIKQIILLPGPCKILVLSSTGLLSFWTYPELSPAQGGTAKVKDTNFIGGLDLDELEREEADTSSVMLSEDVGKRYSHDNSRMVMVLGKKSIKMVRVREEELRLVKNIEYPSLVVSTRRGPIACVATTTDYALLHVENISRIPLFPIVSNDYLPASPGSASGTSARDEHSESEAAQSVSSPVLPSVSEGSDTDGTQKRMPISRRTSSSSASSARTHPPRSSSLQPRARSEVISPSATLRLPAADDSSKHARSVSAGNIKGGSLGRAAGKASPLSREGSVSTGRRTPQGGSSGRVTPSPTSTVKGNHTKTTPSSTSQGKLSIPSRTSKPPFSRSPTPTSSTGRALSPNPPTQSQKPQPKLKPHIVSPTPHEFLLTTGTSMSDPGVGLFVDLNGDPTRGTIAFSKYPDEILLDGGWVIALLGENGGGRVELVPWSDDAEVRYVNGQTSHISLDPSESDHRPGIGKVLELSEMIVEDIGSLLKFDRVRLVRELDSSTEQEEWELKRNLEETEAAIRIAKVSGKLVVFKGKKIWRLISSPMAVILDSRLPQPTLASTSREEGDQRRASILAVLKQLEGLEPTTERMFHEIAYIKQKAGVLLLSEFLRLPRLDDDRQFPAELLATETALIEGSLDPRVVVALFPGFEDELKEGQNGVWVYGGIRRAIDILIEQKHHISAGLEERPVEDWVGRRDILLLLKRYLSAWRLKKGFGSVAQADETEVFWTIDAALIRCLLALEATRPSPIIKHMAGETDLRKELHKMVDYPPSIECFDRAIYLLERFKRLYVLSILYQSKKMTKEVLNTWRRILESDDLKVRGEFLDGEEKVAEYLLARKDRELVREFGLWLARRNPLMGIKVFADENARVKWEPDQVLPFLKQEAPDAVRPYVEYTVIQKKDLRYANDLLLIYLDSLGSTLSSSPNAVERLKTSCEAYRALNLPKPTYRQFLQENTLSANEEDWWIDRLRLLDLLHSASTNSDKETMVCNVEEALEKLEPYRDVLTAESILLYTIAGRHKDSIKLLVHDLRDFDGCAEYCLYGGKKRAIGSTGIKRQEQEVFFGMFLDESLKMEEWTARLEWVERILDNWGGWLDIIQVLSVIPDSYSVSILSKFLISALRRLVREKSESIVIKAFRRGENVRVNAEYMDKIQELGPTIQSVEGAAPL